MSHPLRAPKGCGPTTLYTGFGSAGPWVDYGQWQLCGLAHSLAHGLDWFFRHPGRGFLGGRLVALLDFDWANRRERIRDIGDCLIFFCAERVEAIDPGDIWSLTQGFRIDLRRAAILISAYCEIDGIVASEVAALPTVLSLRWLQMRIRGGRKVSEARRLEFLDRGDLMEVLDAIAEIDLEGLSRAD